MNDVVILVPAGVAGIFIGAFFFGGLLWTVRRGLASKHAALWFLGSGLLRTCVSLTGFYFVSGGRLDRLLACLLGFVIARITVTRFCSSPVKPENSREEDIGHAP